MTVKDLNFETLQKEISDRSRDIWLAGLGVFSVAQEEGNKLFNDFLEKGQTLIERGEELEKKAIKAGIEQQENATEKATDVLQYIEGKLHGAMDFIGISSSNDVERLNDKIDELSETVAELARQLNKK